MAPFLSALSHARERGLRVVAHTGLLDVAEARRLKAAGVEQVLLEVVGDRGTIAEVLRADARPEDYLDAMLACREAGLAFAPHVVIGLHYGSVLGEPAALRMASEAGADALVLVILEPLSGTPMEAVEPPGLGPTAELFAAARELLPSVPLALGCARPHGEDMLRVEELALTSGVDAIAYPHAVTIARAQALDMTIEFSELCCSLAVGGHTPADDSSGSGASTVPGPS